MANIVKTEKNLKLESYYKDGDTRTITLPDPRDDITGSEVVETAAWMKTNQPIIGDKGSAEFVRFNSAKIVEVTHTWVDMETANS